MAPGRGTYFPKVGTIPILLLDFGLGDQQETDFSYTFLITDLHFDFDLDFDLELDYT